MIRKIKNFIKSILFYSDYKKNRIKDNTIDFFIQKYPTRVFIETGTYLGDTLFRLKNKFKILYSIELSEHYFELAKKRFKNVKNIKLIKGDSGEKIKDLLNTINEPIFFWLDGHYSAGLTAKSEVETPIMKELEVIFSHIKKNKLKHIILIDDARLFNGTHDYPSINTLRNSIKLMNSNYTINITEDIIVCTFGNEI